MALYAVNGGQQTPSSNSFFANSGGPDIHSERRPPYNLIDWLNRILIEESRRAMRFRSHYFLTLGHPQKIAGIFLIHSNEKLLHVHAIALRIVQLGGIPAFSVENLFMRNYPRISVNYVLAKLIEEGLQEERAAINSYRDLINYLSTNDMATSGILNIILKSDERRVEELVIWLGDVAKKSCTIRAGKNIFGCDIPPVI